MRNGCSDRLSRAETGSLSIEEVLDLYSGQVDEELGYDDDGETDPIILQCRSEMREAVRVATQLYEAAEDDDAAIELMRQSDNGYVGTIGEALAEGYYAGLAI